MGGEIWPLKVLMLLLLSKNEVAMMHEKNLHILSQKGTDCLVARAQRSVPTSSIPTSRSGDIFNQPNSKGMGQLFSGRHLQ
jgi:hypothetical protein